MRGLEHDSNMLGTRHGQPPPWDALVVGAPTTLRSAWDWGQSSQSKGLSRVRLPWEGVKDRPPKKKYVNHIESYKNHTKSYEKHIKSYKKHIKTITIIKII